MISGHTKYVVFDLETTGLSSTEDAIVEISAIKVIDGSVTDEFSTLVNPGIHIPYSSSSIHGITDDMVADAPSTEEALNSFIDFIGDFALVGHNILRFDMKFIQRDVELFFGTTLDNDIIDTLYLSRKYLPKLCSHSLGALADHYDVSYEGAHRALSDCRITLKVYQYLLNEMTEAIKTVNSTDVCPWCGNELIKRNGKHGEFRGCASFPICKYTKDC